ncbi:helix-turn-helix domain-containing protein [Streptacidiphilus sp. MAP5-3]|uniref:helix-turn-helix domain-containing protein n=1 Tax=unclassified Streptacidiphilus TaxID=2643834 RepID=UPI0035112AD5
MDHAWPALATAIAARREAIPLTQDELAEAMNVGRSTVQKLENPRTTYTKIQPIHREVAYQLGWTRGSIEQVLEGGEPTLRADEAPSPSATQSASMPSGTPQRIRRALTGGEVIDTELIPIDDDSDSGLVMMIKQGDRELPEDKMDLIMHRWVRLTRIARDLYGEDPTEER